ncbi:MAG: cyclic nucleotide-binding domain-containing protein [Chitinispirillaceae bacterium]|nr:cyclic nucleotide-binding domain-containing protein [Chitinispirillaceae bacterium]
MRYYSHVRKKFKAGEVIFSENSESDGMYIVESGKVRVFTHAPADKENVEVDLCSLGPNSMFGEMALIDNGKRSATVQAMEETICTVITKKMFEDQLEQIPSWMVNLIRILVIRLRETNERLKGIIQHYSVPPADSGTVITIAGERSPESGTSAPRDIGEGYSEMKTFYKDKIIQELENLMDGSKSSSDLR